MENYLKDLNKLHWPDAVFGGISQAAYAQRVEIQVSKRLISNAILVYFKKIKKKTHIFVQFLKDFVTFWSNVRL